MIDRAPGELVDLCRAGCRHLRPASGTCAVLESGSLRPLLETTPCDVPRFVAAWAERPLHTRGLALPQAAAEAAQEALVPLSRDGPSAFPRGRRADIVRLRSWLAVVVSNAVIRVLRRDGVAVRVRCSNCRHHSSARGCGLGTLPSGDRNPHAGRAVDGSTDPRRFSPRCDEFLWRRRTVLPGDVDPLAGGNSNPTSRIAREEASRQVLDALETLAADGPEGFRRAVVLRLTYIDGLSTSAIAREIGVAERTVKRDHAEGLVLLRHLLGSGPTETA